MFSREVFHSHKQNVFLHIIGVRAGEEGACPGHMQVHTWDTPEDHHAFPETSQPKSSTPFSFKGEMKEENRSKRNGFSFFTQF